MHIKIISISAKNRFLLGRGVRTVQICQQTIGVCVIDAFSSEETQKNNCFFSGRTTKVQVPLPLDPGGFNFFLIFSFDEKNFFAKWFRGFNPPSPLSGPTTKKKLIFYLCFQRGETSTLYVNMWSLTSLSEEKTVFIVTTWGKPQKRSSLNGRAIKA